MIPRDTVMAEESPESPEAGDSKEADKIYEDEYFMNHRKFALSTTWVLSFGRFGVWIFRVPWRLYRLA